MRVTFMAAALLAALSFAAPSQRTESAESVSAERGRLLYENHCTVCHASVVHVREDRKVQTRADLLAFIVRWQSYLGLGWSAGEVKDVLAYLNEKYYGL